MFALYFVTHCQLYSCRVFSDITSTWHKYFILAFFWVLFIVSKWKWTRTTALFRVLSYCVPILRQANENRKLENQFMRLSIHVYYICLNLWDILPALIYAAHENWSAVEAFCNLSAAYLLILNIHLLRKTYRLDNSLPNVQYVYFSIRRKEEKCSVKLALFCFFNAHNFPDVKGSSFK